MPCDQVRTTTVQWTDATDLAMVAEAMRGLGLVVLSVQARKVVARDAAGSGVTFMAGTLTAPEGFDVDALKRGYSEAVLVDRFSKAGWEVEEEAAPQKAWMSR